VQLGRVDALPADGDAALVEDGLPAEARALEDLRHPSIELKAVDLDVRGVAI
jgi:hypothetical protein